MRVRSLVLLLLVFSQIALSQSKTADADYAVRPQVNVTSWDDGGAISHFAYLHTTEIFPSAIIHRGGPVRELPVALRPEIGAFVVDTVNGKDITLQQYVDQQQIDGYLILHKGKIVYEQYPHMRADDSHLVFSVSKAFTGTILSILEDRKQLDLSLPIEHYLPEMAGTDWAGTSIHDIADMTSGMEGNEASEAAYTDPKHKHFQLEASFGWQPLTSDLPQTVREGNTYEFLRTWHRAMPAGKSQLYTSANTVVLAQLIERITGERLQDAISDFIWKKIGAEHDANILVNQRGVAVSHAGMVMTVRDLARFGLVYSEADKLSMQDRVVSPAFINRLLNEGRPALMPAEHPAWMDHSSYQWDQISREGEIIKGGFAGQILYVNLKKDVVIVIVGTNAGMQMPVPIPIRALVAKFF